MELNRNGRWQEVECIGTDMLKNHSTFAHSQICETVLMSGRANDVQKATAHFVAAVCYIQSEDVQKAEEHLSAYDSLKAALPPGHPALAGEAYARKGCWN